MAAWQGHQLHGRAHADHRASACAAFWTHVDQPILGFDVAQVVRDHHDGVARITQRVQHLELQRNVGKVQARGGLVKNAERAAGVPIGQLVCELDGLGLAEFPKLYICAGAA